MITILMPAFLALCWVASQWQYDRHEVRRDIAQRVEAAAERPAVPLADALAGQTDVTESRRYIRVSVTGQFDRAGELVVRLRRHDGRNGFWVVTPMSTGVGRVPIVRGWIPAAQTATEMPDVPPPPAGRTTIEGWLEVPEAPRSNAGLPRGQIMSVDPSAFQSDVNGFVVQTSLPQQSPAPDLLEDPNPGLGPHFAYSVQWILFGLIGVGTYGYWFVKSARASRRERDAATR